MNHAVLMRQEPGPMVYLVILFLYASDVFQMECAKYQINTQLTKLPGMVLFQVRET
jgi:hypothetical protein